jgi:hypothetical protein
MPRANLLPKPVMAEDLAEYLRLRPIVIVTLPDGARGLRWFNSAEGDDLYFRTAKGGTELVCLKHHCQLDERGFTLTSGDRSLRVDYSDESVAQAFLQDQKREANRVT